jgi:hypothetical protein
MSPVEIGGRQGQILDQFSVDFGAPRGDFGQPASSLPRDSSVPRVAAFVALLAAWCSNQSLRQPRIQVSSGRLFVRKFVNTQSSRHGRHHLLTLLPRTGQTSHRRYEALRAMFVEGLPLNHVADRFGYRPAELRSLVSQFRSGCRAGSPPPFSFAKDPDASLVGACAQTKAGQSSPKSPTVAS